MSVPTLSQNTTHPPLPPTSHTPPHLLHTPHHVRHDPQAFPTHHDWQASAQAKHRVVMAPLTRYRADDDHVHTDLGLEYYSQRASTPGTMLITEGTFISKRAGGDPHIPALETDAQLAAWKKITDAVHAKGSFIVAQLWALGRQADPQFIAQEGYQYIGASDIPLEGKNVSPWGFYGGMRMTDPKPQFSYIIQKIKENHPDLAYIHIVEPRISGISDRVAYVDESNDFIREIWAPRTLLSAGAYNRETGIKAAERGEIPVFGRCFISNPDLPVRLEKNIPLTPYDRSTFYAHNSPKGYIDYPFATTSSREH
ncbi:hypothetical protein EIP91_011513 [Steccherinum ochraceum]|uniref:NADH:flavin oxidoreductase/NADH oxidase N-terminal domain-containing protein n=1 Tax=Steccherinum ochraceum TaxID=92696 RepID=A0A4V2MWZ4_9APHY|nr:hypothetical protein EIP91_011513 [Steccherinum ochraceum]